MPEPYVPTEEFHSNMRKVLLILLDAGVFCISPLWSGGDTLVGCHAIDWDDTKIVDRETEIPTLGQGGCVG